MTRVDTALAAAIVLMMAGSASAQDKDKAMQIFAAQKCTQCHSISGHGSKKGPLDDVGKKLSAAQIKEWITDPEGMAKKTTPPPTRKPPMKKKPIADGDLETLVAYLSTLKK